MHHCTNDDTAGYHGTDGPLTVSDVMVTSLTEAFIVAGAELNHKFTDLNAHSQQGVFKYTLNLQHFMFIIMLRFLL